MRDILAREIPGEISEKGSNGDQMVEGDMQIDAVMD
jgi:hypothetical protein